MKDENLITMFKAGSRADTSANSYENLIRKSAKHMPGDLILECMDDLKSLRKVANELMKKGSLSGEPRSTDMNGVDDENNYEFWTVPDCPRPFAWGILIIAQNCPSRDGEKCVAIFPTESGCCVREECPMTFQKMLCDDCTEKSTDEDTD